MSGIFLFFWKYFEIEVVSVFCCLFSGLYVFVVVMNFLGVFRFMF